MEFHIPLLCSHRTKRPAKICSQVALLGPRPHSLSPSLPALSLSHPSHLVGNSHGVEAKVSRKTSIQLSRSLEEREGLGLGHRHHAAGTGGLCVGGKGVRNEGKLNEVRDVQTQGSI